MVTMTSTRQVVLEILAHYGLATVRLICLATGLERKNVERILAFLRHDNKIQSFALDLKTKVYTLTVREAIRRDLDPRRFRRAPSFSVLRERLCILAFCLQQRIELMPRAEFAELFPELAAIDGFDDTRYFLDTTYPEQTRLGLCVPCYGKGDTRYIAKKCRRQIEERKRHKNWMDVVCADSISIWVATGTEARAQRIARRLRRWTVAHVVVVVPEICRFWLGGGS
jgi:hypothetical protein